MPIVFIIAEDWTLRTGVRAELRERGIEALGMDSAADAGSALAAGEMPAAIVLEAESRAARDPAVRQLAARAPTILIASHTRAAPAIAAVKILFRPVRIGEIVAAVLALLQGQMA
jgi:DNA-binding response OmpR family regulator